MRKKSAREQAIDKIIVELEKRYKVVKRKIIGNRVEFKKLTSEQTVLKREAAEISNLINDLKKKGTSTNGKA